MQRVAAVEVFQKPLVDRSVYGPHGSVPGQRLRVIAHAEKVPARLRIARIGQLGQGEDGHVLRGGPLAGALLDELLQAVGVDFQFLLGRGQLPLRAGQAEVDPHLGEHLVVVERLDDVVVGLGLVALEPSAAEPLPETRSTCMKRPGRST